MNQTQTPHDPIKITLIDGTEHEVLYTNAALKRLREALAPVPLSDIKSMQIMDLVGPLVWAGLRQRNFALAEIDELIPARDAQTIVVTCLSALNEQGAQNPPAPVVVN